MALLTVPRRRLMHEGLWALSGTILGAIGTLAGTRLITEYVPRDVFGSVSLLLGVLGLGQNLLIAPVLQAAQRFHSSASLTASVGHLRRVVIGLLWRAAGVLGLLFVTAGSVYAWRTGLSLLCFPILAAMMAFEVWRMLEIGFFTAARRQKAVALIGTALCWVQPLCVVGVVLLARASTPGVLLGYAISSVLGVAALLPVAHRLEGAGTPVDGTPDDRRLVREIVRYGLPMMPLALVGWINSLSDRYVIGLRLGAGEVGIYAAGYGLISRAFLIAGGTLTQTFRPVLYQIVSAGERRRGTRLLVLWFGGTSLIALVGVGCVCLLGKIVVRLLLAEEYRSCITLLPWLSLGMGLQICSQVFENVLFAYGRIGSILIAHSIGACVCLVSLAVLTSRFGVMGAAYACPIYYGAILAATFTLARRAMRAGNGQ